MPATLESKLLLKPDERLFIINAPKAAPPIQQVAKDIDLADAVLLFALKQDDVKKQVAAVPPQTRLWICYPKAGKLDTDLGRDSLWQLMKDQGYEGVRVVSVDDTWSAFWFKR